MTVVVSYLPTAEGHAALDQGLVEARDRKASLVVIPSRGAQEDLREQLGRVDTGSVPTEVLDPGDGPDITEFLLDVVRTRAPALLVVGLRRRSAVGKLILGFHVQRLVLDADCPVLCVKPDRAGDGTSTPPSAL